ncbi:MAG: DUF6641 family protein [Rhodospirillaceae bacterium]
MTSILDSLTVVDIPRKQALPAHVALRMRLNEAVDLQIAAAKADLAGENFTRKVERYITDSATGERVKAKVDGRFRRWWWAGENGKLFLEAKYANKGIELKPGKRTIEVGAKENLIPTLERLKSAITAGELDKSLNAALTLRRKELKGNKPKSA